MANESKYSGREIARAKVNLFLHVKGKRPDGYHELESLVAFADVCDRVTFALAASDSVQMAGEFSAAVEGDNLILKAKNAVTDWLDQDFFCTFFLEKNIPVAAGLGGGSSDAAATVRLLFRHFEEELPETPAFFQTMAKVGADVPVCLVQHAAVMRGIGEKVTKINALPRLPALLVNPRVKLSTRDVFQALNAKPFEAGEDSNEPLLNASWTRPEDVAAALRNTKNDLETPARALEPKIDEVLCKIAALPGCLLSRLSGSGPTCFGLFRDPQDVRAAKAWIETAYPGWWVAATTFS